MAITIKEAILKSLGDLKKPTTAGELYDHIVAKEYYVFTEAKTSKATVHSRVGSFIRKGDSRVARFKDGKKFKYYLTEFADEFDLGKITSKTTDETKASNYLERDLHPLVVTYLHSINVQAKTIYHEKSKNSRDDNQKWIHPDLVGVRMKGYKDIRILRQVVS